MDAQEKKIRQSIWIILGVGIALTIALAVGLVQTVVKKQREQIAATQASYERSLAVAKRLPEALAAQRKAEDAKAYVATQLAFFRQRYRSLPFGALEATQLSDAEKRLDADKQAALLVANRNIAWRRWMNEYASGYGVALKRELEDAANSTGVTLKTQIKVGNPPRAPEEAVPPANGLFRPTGGALPITVSGSLGNIMQFYNRINQASILMLVGSDIKFSGASPNITGTFSITPFLLASGNGAPITAGAAAAAAPAGGPGGASPPPGGAPPPPSGGGSSNSASGGSSNSAP
jgi:hypothetical protein